MNKQIFTLLVMCTSAFLFAQEGTDSVAQDYDHPNNIRSYLCNQASHMTARALTKISDLEDWTTNRDDRVKDLVEMLGLQDHGVATDRQPPEITKTGTLQDDGFRIEKFYYESLPDLFVPANLYIPEGTSEPMPAILYVCGHAHTQKHHYQSHARTLAKHGFVCIIIETIQRGEVKGEHLGAESLGWFHWYSRGYNPAGVEVWNGIRAIDILADLPEVDKERIGVTGISGGGSQSWYLPAIDGRIKAVAAVAGAASLEGQICQRTIDDHCDCMMPINTYGIDFSDIGALIAPRPFMIAQTTGDGYYSIEAVRTIYQKIRPIYLHYGHPQNLTMIEAPGGHSYGANNEFRSSILFFFEQELMGKDAWNEDLQNMEIEDPWTNDQLKAYVIGAPPNDLTKTIQDRFVSLAEPPVIETLQQLESYRSQVKAFLKRKTFGAFPDVVEPSNVRLEFGATDFGEFGTQHYSFVSEKGWRLKFSIRRRRSPQDKAPLLLVLRNAGEKRWASNALSSGAADHMNIVYFETRGVGESGWDPSLQWHIRRAAAWTGRTIASMQVYDVLRCIQVLREMPGVDPDNIYLAAQDEMAAIAPYAALLDGNIKALILKNPPATQNMASESSGQGAATEMLNCLRITDLPQVVGMMYPNEILGLGELPETYQWSKDLYENLGQQGAFKQLEKLSEWDQD
ncbi:MAG: hypothetical protein HKN87_21025 [Saprospiraceae bacterium]|nr:hypothetical protein [Saprospiraceae bacterium]